MTGPRKNIEGHRIDSKEHGKYGIGPVVYIRRLLVRGTRHR